MSINWLEPVYHINDVRFKNPGKVWCIDGPGDYPVVISWEDCTGTYRLDGSEFAPGNPVIRNRPKTVLYERWVNLYPDGSRSAWYGTEAEADRNMRGLRVGPARRIVWKSDGSPVDEPRLTEAERGVIEAAEKLVARFKSMLAEDCRTTFYESALNLIDAVNALEEEAEK